MARINHEEHHEARNMKRVTGTTAERLNEVRMSESDRAWAQAYLAGIENVVDFLWRVAAHIRGLADAAEKSDYSRAAWSPISRGGLR